jgi:hypothetical protein
MAAIPPASARRPRFRASDADFGVIILPGVSPACAIHAFQPRDDAITATPLTSPAIRATSHAGRCGALGESVSPTFLRRICVTSSTPAPATAAAHLAPGQ